MPTPQLQPVVVTGTQQTPLQTLLLQQRAARPPTEFDRLASQPRADSDFQRLLNQDFVPKGREVPNETVLDKVVVKAKRFARPLTRAARFSGVANAALLALDVHRMAFEAFEEEVRRATNVKRRGGSDPLPYPKISERGDIPGTHESFETDATLDPVEVRARKTQPARQTVRSADRSRARVRRRDSSARQQRQRDSQAKAAERSRVRRENERARETKLKEKAKEQQERARERERALKEKQKTKDEKRREREKERREKKKKKKELSKLKKTGKKLVRKFAKKRAPLTAAKPGAAESTQTKGKEDCGNKPQKQSKCGCPNPKYKEERKKWEEEFCGLKSTM